MTSKDNPGQPSATEPGTHRRRVSDKQKQKRPTNARPVDRKRLVDTDGPDANVPPEQVVFTVGVVVGAHGLGGTLKVRIASDDPEHLLTVAKVTLGDESVPHTVNASQLHAGQLLLTLDGMTTPEEASAFVGQPVRLPAAALRPLEPNEFFIYQLLGLSVETESGERLGTVTDLIETGANDVLVVSPGGAAPDLLLPMIPAVISDVNPVAGTIVARTLEYYGDT